MADKKSSAPKQTPEEREHALLSWSIIEWKVAYYRPEMVHRSRKEDYEISDEAYDAHEQRYLTLCRILGLQNTVVHKEYPGFEDVGTKHAMIEVDMDRPSVKLVVNKLSSSKTLKRKRKK